MRGTSAAGCRQMVKRQAEREVPQSLHKKEGLRFPANSPQGWGEYVAMAVELVIATDGKSWRRKTEEKEGSPFIAASSEMQGSCQRVLMPGGEEWM